MTRFDARAHRFWFITLTDRLGAGWLGGALIIAAVPYVLGLILVAPFGYASLYLRTPAFYIGFGGIALVMAASVRGMFVLTAGLDEVAEVACEPDKFTAFADEQLHLAARGRSNVAVLAISFAGAIAVVAHALKRWSDTGIVPAGPHFRAFLVEWRASDALVPVGLALGVFAIAVAITVGTSVALLLRNLPFAWRLRTFQYAAFPGQVRLSVRRLVAAYTWVSGTWTGGMALFALFFFEHWSGLNLAGIVIGLTLGVLTLAVPYSSFRKMLDTAHDQMSVQLAQKVALDDSKTVEYASNFAAINAAITADPPPVLTRRGAIAYGAVQLTVFASIIAKDFLQEQVSFLAHEPAAKEHGRSNHR